jgi:hypothetical protein
MNARSATETLATLAETAVDLHIRDLATQLGLGGEGRFSPAAGEEITTLLRKDR